MSDSSDSQLTAGLAPNAANYQNCWAGGYESPDILGVWLKAYEIEKERQFIKRIDRLIPGELITLLDMGCGTGLHAHLWAEQKKKVTASDFSRTFGEHIRRAYTFPFVWNDVLHCTIREQYDICFCMGISTILHEEGPRFQTFETLARLVRDGAFLVFVWASNQWLFGGRSGKVVLHSIDDRDFEKLRELGLAIEKVFYWSSTPKGLWRSAGLRPLGRLVEGIGSRLGIGARKVVICRKAQT